MSPLYLVICKMLKLSIIFQHLKKGNVAAFPSSTCFSFFFFIFAFTFVLGLHNKAVNFKDTQQGKFGGPSTVDSSLCYRAKFHFFPFTIVSTLLTQVHALLFTPRGGSLLEFRTLFSSSPELKDGWVFFLFLCKLFEWVLNSLHTEDCAISSQPLAWVKPNTILELTTEPVDAITDLLCQYWQLRFLHSYNITDKINTTVSINEFSFNMLELWGSCRFARKTRINLLD